MKLRAISPRGVIVPHRSVAHERQLPPVLVGVVTYLREARGAGEMPEDQHDEVACRRELPRVHAVRVRGLFDEPAWDPLNNLPQSMVYSWRRLVVVCFHACKVYRKTGKATLLIFSGHSVIDSLCARFFTLCLWYGSGFS